MAKHYDNLEDVKSKLAATIIYHDKIPVYCKTALCDGYGKEFFLQITKSLSSKVITQVPLVDPKLNWTEYNIGYTNHECGALWWYRKPIRQYRQGLKNEQMGYIASEKTYNPGAGFGINKSVEAMLLNQYPDIDEIEKKLKDTEVPVVAFHKDFALSWDKIHKDMLIEHKGKLIGCMQGKLSKIQLADDYEYLTETIQEIIGVR